MKRILALLALALLLFIGLNCGTENPVEETVDTSAEATPTETLPEAGQSEETSELPVQLTGPPEPEKLDPGQGLSLESQAPAFELPDGDGKLHALADYIGNKNVVLVFYRGGW